MKKMLFATLASLLMALPAHASPSKGTLVKVLYVPPQSGVMYSDLELRGGESTRFTVESDRNISCKVLKGSSELVSEGCRVSVTPEKTSVFTLVIVNHDPEIIARTTLVIQ